MVKTFRDLLIWQIAMTLAAEVYDFSNLLPESEKFGLMSQMKRCAVSIPSNIAEGYGRNSKKDFRRFLRITMGSLFELQTQIELSKNVISVCSGKSEHLFQRTRELERMLSSFIHTL